MSALDLLQRLLYNKGVDVDVFISTGEVFLY